MLPEIEFLLRTYNEDESHLCVGDPEPYMRWLNIVYRSQSSSWHIKVIFIIKPLSECPIFLNNSINHKLKRRQEFQTFVSYIDYECFSLFDNTVTEIELTFESKERNNSGSNSKNLPLRRNVKFPKENRFISIAHKMRWISREDFARVLYPSYVEDTFTSKRWLADIRKKESIAGGVFRVQFDEDINSYIYKEIDKPFYDPADTQIILQEMENLKLFRGISNIVQLLAVVVSPNPYQTNARGDNSIVIRGILLEHHTNGTLEMTLTNAKDFPWYRWPLQIGIGLAMLHQKNITHMDLKPSNIVIDCHGNAVIIDISGIGGVTYEWLAPEIHKAKDPLSFSFEARKANDIWAYGQLISIIAKSVVTGHEVNLLTDVSECLTKVDPTLRIELSYALPRLKMYEQEIEKALESTAQLHV